MKTNEEIKSILSFDPMDAVEKLTGDLNAKPGLAMLTVATHSARVRATMKEINDAYYGMSYQEFISQLEFNGFEQALHEEFEADVGTCHCFIYIHRQDRLLVFFDTYSQDHVNHCSFYFSWKPNNFKELYKNLPGCSGGLYDADGVFAGRSPAKDEELIFAGDFDGREAPFFKLRGMRRTGSFVNWPKGQAKDIWLATHADKTDMIEAGKQRFARLPQEIQEIFA